jgi:mono/diheme cytochrome c family protein
MNMRMLFLACLTCCATAQAQNRDPDFFDQKHLDQVTGEQIFTHVCQGCHMADAKGAKGAGHYPALANNPKLASAAYPAVMIIQGRGGMPGFGNLFTDAHVADVVNYVRTHFGNGYTDTLKPEDVKALRPAAAPPVEP